MMPGCVVRGTERLGRRLFSKTSADRAFLRGRVLPKEFDSGNALISVDRLTAAPAPVVERAARETSIGRPPLQGWAVVGCNKARDADRRVRASPADGNPYHADIALPAEASVDRELRKRHAQELAKAARWQASSTYKPPTVRPSPGKESGIALHYQLRPHRRLG